MDLIIKTLLIYLLVMNVVAFVAYGIDKYKAKRNLWRIPENVLISLAAIGGSAGALFGMMAFHHKTKKIKFCVLVPVLLIIHISLGVAVAATCH